MIPCKQIAHLLVPKLGNDNLQLNIDQNGTLFMKLADRVINVKTDLEFIIFL